MNFSEKKTAMRTFSLNISEESNAQTHIPRTARTLKEPFPFHFAHVYDFVADVSDVFFELFCCLTWFQILESVPTKYSLKSARS